MAPTKVKTPPLGGTFTPGGFVPNKPTVPLPTDRAPYKSGKSPEQQSAKAAAKASGVKVQHTAVSESDAQRAAHTMAVQRQLNAAGFHLAVDGQWGPATESAYQAYLHHQTRAGAQAQADTPKIAAPLPTPKSVAAGVEHYRQTESWGNAPFFDGQKPIGHHMVGDHVMPIYENPHHGSTGLGKIPGQIKDLTYGQLTGLGSMVGHDILAPVAQVALHEAPKQIQETPEAQATAKAPVGNLASDVQSLATGAATFPITTLEHPLRNLPATAMAILTIADPLLRVGALVHGADVGAVTAEDVSAASRMGPVDTPKRAALAQALDQAPNISPQDAQASLAAYDTAAHIIAARRGITPEQAWETVLPQAHYVAASPTEATFGRTVAAMHSEPQASMAVPTQFQKAPHATNFKADAQAIFDQTHATRGKTAPENIFPPGIDTPAKLADLLKELQLRAHEAADFRHWYETSGKAILAHVNGDPVEAQKIAALIAVYSPQMKVYHFNTTRNNLDYAMKAYDTFKETGQVPPTLKGVGAWQPKAAQQIMEGDFSWGGLKTNRFYRNFYHYIDPAGYAKDYGDELFSTQDLWMKRAMKYNEIEVKNDAQYHFMHAMTKAVADSLGWTPDQAQAAIWTSIKAETEGTPLEKGGLDFADAFPHQQARQGVMRHFGSTDYRQFLKDVHYWMTGEAVKGDLGSPRIARAQAALATWARHDDSPAALAWRAVTTEMEEARHAPSAVAALIPDNPLLEAFAKAQGRELVQFQHGDANAIIKGALTGDRLYFFEHADASTAAHELAHILEPHLPDSVLAHTSGGEHLARSLEEWLRTSDTGHLPPALSHLGAKIDATYHGTVPGSDLSPGLRDALDHLFGQKDYHVVQEDHPSTPTLWHNGSKGQIASTNRMIGEGDLLHFHAYDREGNLLGAAHGSDLGDRVHLTSVRVHPEHEGRGIGTALVDQFRQRAGDRPITSVFANEQLGAREVARSQALGRDTSFDPMSAETRFQTETPEEGKYGLTKEQLDEAAQAFVREAKPGRRKQNISDTEERGRRAALAEAALRDKTEPDGLQRQINALAELKGHLPKVEWQGRDTLDSNTVAAMIDHIHERSDLGTYEKIRAVRAIDRLFDIDRPPTESEFKLIERIFGKQPGLRSLKDDVPRWKALLYEVLNIPRSIMASFDLSAPLRQGLVLGSQHPVIAAGAMKDMIRMFASEKFYKGFMDGVHASPNAPLYERMGLAVTDLEHAHGTEAGEEAFASGLAERLFTLNLRRIGTERGRTGSPIRWSGRAYTGFLVKLRTDVADHLLAEAEKSGIHIQTEEKFLRDLGDFINAATGRGKVLKKLEGSLDALNATLFSPRLMASRMNFLNFVNPENYLRLDPFVRRQKILAAASTAGVVATVLGLASLVSGVSVGLNPRSADFAKIRVGDTRMDIAGGFQQYIRLFSEIGTMSTTSSTSGRTTSLWSRKYGAKTGMDVLVNFLEGKAAPLPAVGIDVLRGHDAVGNPITPWNEFVAHITPLIGQDVKDIYGDPPIKGMNPLLAAFLGYGGETFGTGLQTYAAKPPGAKGVNATEAAIKKLGWQEPPWLHQELLNEAALRSIAVNHPNDKAAALREMVAYYKKVTGYSTYDRVLTWKNVSDASASRVEKSIRAKLVHAGTKRIEKRVKKIGAK